LVLLLQLNGDLPERFPGHERRLYIWACRRKPCRRKDGSIRAVRGVRVTRDGAGEPKHGRAQKEKAVTEPIPEQQQGEAQQDLGAALFGGNSSFTASDNPVSASLQSLNPFSASFTSPFSSAPGALSSLAAKPAQPPIDPSSLENNATNLPETFAQKARITIAPPRSPSTSQIPIPIPWPAPSVFPTPYPLYHLDADYEYLSSPSSTKPNGTHHTTFMDTDPIPSNTDNNSSGGREDTDPYESSHDRTFQNFADTLAQNPEQVLRYDFGGQPLLYSRTDPVGKLFSSNAASGNSKITTSTTATPAQGRIPRCQNCGAARVFELQLTPHAITELEAEEDGVVAEAGDGMEWGSVVLSVCEQDCYGPAGADGGDGDDYGAVRYYEEWVGVQWEELVVRSVRGR